MKRHPRPKKVCPRCGKAIAYFKDGRLYWHTMAPYMACSASERRFIDLEGLTTQQMDAEYAVNVCIAGSR